MPIINSQSDDIEEIISNNEGNQQGIKIFQSNKTSHHNSTIHDWFDRFSRDIKATMKNVNY